MARPLHSFITALTMGALLIAPAYAAPAASQPAGTSDVVAAHVTFDGGGAQVQEDGTANIIDAPLNTPVFAGDTFGTSTGPVELLIDETTLVRLAPHSQIFITSLSPGNRALYVDWGTIEVRAFSIPALSVETRGVIFEPQVAGAYRIEADTSTTLVTVRQGRASISRAGGDLFVEQGTMATANTAVPDVITQNAPSGDSFEAWNDQRDVALGVSTNDARLNPILGANALDAYGRWINSEQYGLVWSPNEGPGWAPYTLGRWIDTPMFGPVWVSSEPWGWAPYHYGRWVNDTTYGWIWIPDQGVVSWAPALVGFMQPIEAGGLPAPGTWYPLHPDDCYVPWYDETSNASPNGSHNNTNVPIVRNLLPPPHLFARPGFVPPSPSIRYPEQNGIGNAAIHMQGGASGAARGSSGGSSRSGGGGARASGGDGGHASSSGGGGGHESSGGGGGRK